MTEPMSMNGNGSRALSLTARDVAAIGFRHKRVMGLCFAGIVFGVLLSALLLPSQYKAETKLLVNRERVDPVVSADASTPMTFHDTISEEELNSEVELIQSEDVLRKVVLEQGLNKKKGLLSRLNRWTTDEARVDKAVRRLRADLHVEALKKSNVIDVSYESSSPAEASGVLHSLNQAYLQKHLEVHHPAGKAEFFDQETEQYKKALMDSEEKLKTFAAENGGVAPTAQRDMTLQKLSEFSATLEGTRAQIAETRQRIHQMESASQSTPTRMTTQIRKTPNAQVLETLKGTLLTLELKRTELLTKYQPTYPLVQEVDKQIADAKSSLVKEESTPLNEVTTDQNPTYGWLSGEMAKAQADLSGLEARQAATQAIVAVYTKKARELDTKGILHEDLIRTTKANEENYLLYAKKREEARISNAMDQTRILNVAVAQEPLTPALPSRSPWMFGLIGCFLAAVVSIGVVLVLDYTDQSFRTPNEVLTELRVPVLAAVPRPMNVEGANGAPSNARVAAGKTVITR